MKRYDFALATIWAAYLAFFAWSRCELQGAETARRRPELAFGAPSSDYVERTGFIAARSTHCTAWTIEHHTSAHLVKKASRAGLDFVSDPLQPREFRWSNRDYFGAGFDRGHQAAAENLVYDFMALRDSFLLTNTMPQTPELNRGPWHALENHVRLLWADEGVEVWVFTGPAWLQNESEKIVFAAIGEHRVWVPTHCWKAVLVKHGQHLSMRGWLLPNTPQPPADFQSCAVSIDQIEAAVGLDLFAGLDDDVEDALEAKLR